jgi:hypothetical protein
MGDRDAAAAEDVPFLDKRHTTGLRGERFELSHLRRNRGDDFDAALGAIAARLGEAGRRLWVAAHAAEGDSAPAGVRSAETAGDSYDDGLLLRERGQAGVRLVVIEGNIGAGKTTLLTALERRGISVERENIGEWASVLAKFYATPGRWAFALQTAVLLSMARQQYA